MQREAVKVKLTRKSGRSAHGAVKWAVGATLEIPPEARGHTLCCPGLLHVYEGATAEQAALLGTFLDRVHADCGPDASAFVVTGRAVARQADKVGCHRLRVLREIPVPKPTTAQRVRFALLAARAVLKRGEIPQWDAWADRREGENGAAALKGRAMIPSLSSILSSYCVKKIYQ